MFENSDHAAALFGLQQFGNIYSRIMNPTNDVLEKRVAALEGGVAALATASGQAAETLTMLTLANSGDEIVSTTSLYGGTYNLFHYTLPKLGIKVRFVEADDYDGLRKAINDRTRAVYTESLGNPKLDVVDLEKLASIAHENGLPLIVDNTVPSPILCNPIQWGADIVVHSATKFLGGHGNSIAGVIVDSGKFDWAKSGRFRDFVEPDPSYHGLSYTGAFANLAFILKARVKACATPVPAFLPSTRFSFCRGLKLSTCACSAIQKTRWLSQKFWKNIPASNGSTILAWPAASTTRSQKNICPTDPAPLSPSVFAAATTPASNLLTRSSSSACWRISAIPNLW